MLLCTWRGFANFAAVNQNCASMGTYINPLKPLWRSIPAPLRNRYFVVLGVFVFWMIFIDKHSITTQYSLGQALKKIAADRQVYEAQIVKARQDRKDLDVNKEKYARERYYMHKSDEDVFVIEEQ